jgi:hypothetical protein
MPENETGRLIVCMLFQHVADFTTAAIGYASRLFEWQCPDLEGHVYPPLAAPKATRALSWPRFANGRACATKRYGARRRDGARPSKLQIRTLPFKRA